MLKQDFLIAIVSVSAIVYVILFDSTMSGIFARPTPGAVAGPLTTAPAQKAEPGDDDPRHYEPEELANREAQSSQAAGRLLLIAPEGDLTREGRQRLIAEVTSWLDRPINSELARLREDLDAITQLSETLTAYHVGLEPALKRAFEDKIGELKRYYVFQRTTAALSELATSYTVPGPAERASVEGELKRLRQLERDVVWVEMHYAHEYPKDRKVYLHQLVEVLENMTKI